jgi:GNAT superfamily N-acetyltransferase
VGTIAPFVNHQAVEHLGEKVGGFGFFEVVEDYAVAGRLLDTARDWVKARGMTILRGPTNFGTSDTPGVLIEGADCPPVVLEAHTPSYYKTFLERYGMEKYNDVFAWRAFRSQIGAEMENMPADLLRVAEAAPRRAGVTIRKARLENWDEEVVIAHHLFNITLEHLADHIPMSEAQFRRLANQLRPLLDPDLVLFAEVDGKPIGFCGAIPDINRALIHLNGRLFPFGWLKLWWYMRRIDVVSFKLMGVLEEYRRRGIDALLYLELIKAVFAKGYQWLDGSLTSEFNLMVNFLASRLGAERYKHYRIYQIEV